MQFPRVSGTNLSGKRYQLPQDFEGTYNLILIAYEQYQQYDVDTWMPFVRNLAAADPDLCYYELPTLARYGWLQQYMIDSGMRMGIPDKAVRDRTITLYLDVAQFNAALELAGTRSIYVLLIDRAGAVIWQTAGSFSAEKGEQLRNKLSELRML